MDIHVKKADILIVDDIPVNIELLATILKRKEFKVRAVPSGKMVMKAVEASMPDIILLDINMPEMNGFEVCKLLKSHHKYKDIPVLFLSALTDSNDKIKAFAVGGVDYITKPFEVEEVNARVETHLAIRNMQKELEKHNRELEEKVKEKMKEIYLAQMATITSMVKLAEARDDDTGVHIERIKEYCKILAEKAKTQDQYKEQIDNDFIENLYYASALHDIGKVAIRDAILLKPGKLTNEEFEIMKTHTTLGAVTLAKVYENYKISFIKMGIDIAKSHHEKWNGAGYPEKLVGEAIPLSARIVAIADVYDALRTKRVYKEAFSHEKTMRIMIDGRGTHFDPALLDLFVENEKEFERVRDLLEDDSEDDDEDDGE